MKTRITLTIVLVTLSACGGGNNQNTTSPLPPPKPSQGASIENVERRELTVENGNLQLTEYAYCVREHESADCNKQALLEFKAKDQEKWFLATLPFASRPSVTELTTEDGRTRFQRLPASTTQKTKVAVDFSAVEDILDRNYFFALYRCRFTSESRRLIDAGPALQGNYVIQQDGFFSVSNESGILPTFEFDRLTKGFVGFSLYVIPRHLRVVQPDHTTLELVLSATHNDSDFATGSLKHAPVKVRTSEFRSTCDRLYEVYRNSSIFKSPIESDPSLALLQRWRESYLPLLDEDLESDSGFRKETEDRTNQNGNLFESRWTSVELDELFFDGRQYPSYPYESDALWFEIQKIKQETLK